MDTYYYDELEVPETATASEIKKAYFRLARVYHPDKNPGDAEAEARFKRVAEAYQILIDPEKREFYDKHGREGTQAKEQGTFVDPRELFQLMFGGGKFKDIFGEVSMLEMMELDASDPDAIARFEQAQRDRIIPLAGSLLGKLQLYVNGDITGFRALVTQEAVDLIDSPGGPELVYLTGYVYTQEARKHSGGFLGLDGFWAGMQQRGHSISSKFSVLNSAVKAQIASERLESGKSGANRERDEAIAAQEGMSALWKLGKLEVENTIRMVCETTFGDSSIEKSIRKLRCEAAKIYGQIFHTMGAERIKLDRKVGKQKGTDPVIEWPPRPS